MNHDFWTTNTYEIQRTSDRKRRKNSLDLENEIIPVTKSSPSGTFRVKRTKSDNVLSVDELFDLWRLNIDNDAKPPFSYATMIGVAILQSPEGKLTLSQIYHWFSSHFSYFKTVDCGWQNSVRHNLSLNPIFVKAGRTPEGKGHYWQIVYGYEHKILKHDDLNITELQSKLQELDFITTESGQDNAVVHTPVQSPKTFEKFACSFNSEIFDRSPSSESKRTQPSDLIVSSLWDDDLVDETQRSLLRTPNTDSYDMSPYEYYPTSRDQERLELSKGHTSSNLFEDCYDSALVTNTTPLKPSSRVEASVGKLMSPQSKLNITGLFGVDVYSVLLRAKQK